MKRREPPQLGELLTRGDPSALRLAYECHGGLVMTIALGLLRDVAEAEDVVQDTFLQVWNRRLDYDSTRGALGPWLATVARSRSIDRLRRRSAAEHAAMELRQGTSIRAIDPPDLGTAVGDRERIHAALANLPTAQRGTVELAYFQGLSHRQIADHMGEPLGTVKTRLRLALEKLSDALLAGPRQGVAAEHRRAA